MLDHLKRTGSQLPSLWDEVWKSLQHNHKRYLLFNFSYLVNLSLDTLVMLNYNFTLVLEGLNFLHFIKIIRSRWVTIYMIAENIIMLRI